VAEQRSDDDQVAVIGGDAAFAGLMGERDAALARVRELEADNAQLNRLLDEASFRDLRASGGLPEAGIGDLYNELLMAVATKWPGETRHATALRYIRQSEPTHSSSAGCDAARQEPTDGK